MSSFLIVFSTLIHVGRLCTYKRDLLFDGIWPRCEAYLNMLSRSVIHTLLRNIEGPSEGMNNK